MFLFDIFFYSFVASITIAMLFVFRSSAARSKLAKTGKGIVVFLGILAWIWVVAIWILPKGSKWQEAVNLPKHLSTLSMMPATDSDGEQLSYGTDEKQYILYWPAAAKSQPKDKVIFYWHGGGWHTGSPEQHRHLARVLSEQGYAVYSFAYRLGPTYGYNAIREDANEGMLFALEHLRKQGVENPKIVLGGTSAGGNVAGLLAYDEQRWLDLKLDRNQLKGFFSIVGVLNLDHMEQTYVLQNYAGLSTDSTYRLANPIAYLSAADTIPLLCLHGNKDGLVPIGGVESFCDAARAIAPNNVHLHTFEDCTHLEVGSAWYYEEELRIGQDSVLVDWLARL